MANGYRHFLYDVEDIEVKLTDWSVSSVSGDGVYCVSVGKYDSVKIIGDLDKLAQVFAVGESLVEIERIRRIKQGVLEDAQVEKKRAEGK